MIFQEYAKKYLKKFKKAIDKIHFRVYNLCVSYRDTKRGCVGMADEVDSKSIDGNIVWVQVPSSAYIMKGGDVK